MGNMIVVMNDGTKLEVKIKPGDIVKFERKFDVPVSKLQEEQRYEWLLYLAGLVLNVTALQMITILG